MQRQGVKRPSGPVNAGYPSMKQAFRWTSRRLYLPLCLVVTQCIFDPTSTRRSVCIRDQFRDLADRDGLALRST